MITRNDVKMVGFAVVGIAFILAGLFAKTMNVGGSRPSTVKWYHRLIAICVGIYSIIIVIQLYGER
jgi:hypothetical protein